MARYGEDFFVNFQHGAAGNASVRPGRAGQGMARILLVYFTARLGLAGNGEPRHVKVRRGRVFLIQTKDAMND